jgi:hypothetical protein
VIRSHRRGVNYLAGLLAVLFLTASCSIQGLNFREDKRVTITSPRERAQVRFPFTVEWNVNGFQITGPDRRDSQNSGYFGFFLDRTPQPPGKPFAWLVKDDRNCQLRPGCPDNLYFQNLGIHSTTKTSLTINSIIDPDPLNINVERREFHRVVIILMNGRGERIGESAFRVEFEVMRS